MSYMRDTLSMRIDAALKRDLQRFCKQQKRRPSDVAREALRRHLALEELRALRERLRPRAEAAGFLTDEDVFKAVS